MTLRRETGSSNFALQLYLYCNQFQLGNAEILYSDGDRYRPAIAAVKHLKAFLPSVKKVLVLGTGLGSMVRVLHSKGYKLQYTLVEYDKMVLQWAMETLDELQGVQLEPVCADAKIFMAKNNALYDLVFIDIFIGRVVPDFVAAEAFLQQCKNSLAPGGRLAFNYIINDMQQWEDVQRVFASVFPDHTVVKHEVNRVFITG